MQKHFVISLKFHREKVKYHLIAPEPIVSGLFTEICYELFPVAAKTVLDKYKNEKYPIGWQEVLDETVRILVCDYGYERFYPEKLELKTDARWFSHSYHGESDHLLGDDLNDIIHHNDVSIWGVHNQAVS